MSGNVIKPRPIMSVASMLYWFKQLDNHRIAVTQHLYNESIRAVAAYKEKKDE